MLAVGKPVDGDLQIMSVVCLQQESVTWLSSNDVKC